MGLREGSVPAAECSGPSSYGADYGAPEHGARGTPPEAKARQPASVTRQAVVGVVPHQDLAKPAML